MSNKYFQTISNILVAQVAKANKGKPVEPPSAPPPQSNYVTTGFELFIPYALGEFPRTFLHLLKVSPDTPPEMRSAITTFLEEHDSRLMDWMRNQYGPGIDHILEAVTSQVMQAQHIKADVEAKAEVDNVIEGIEELFHLEDGENDNEA